MDAYLQQVIFLPTWLPAVVFVAFTLCFARGNPTTFTDPRGMRTSIPGNCHGENTVSETGTPYRQLMTDN